MTRGAPEAVPPHALRALKAMGVTTIEMDGRGIGLIFSGDIPNFLKLDPFKLTPLESETTEVAEPEADDADIALEDAPEDEIALDDAPAEPDLAAEAPDLADAEEVVLEDEAVAEDGAFEPDLHEEEEAVAEAPEDASDTDIVADETLPEAEAADEPAPMWDDAAEAPEAAWDEADDTTEAEAEDTPLPEVENTADLAAETAAEAETGIEADEPLDMAAEDAVEAEAAEAEAEAEDVSEPEPEFEIEAEVEETPEPEAPADVAAMPDTAANDAVTERLDRIEAMLTALQDQPAAAPAEGQDERLSQLEAGLTRLLEQQSDLTERMAGLDSLFDRLQSGLDDVAKRPIPTPDLSAQQRSFAAFGTALGNFQKRVEALADRMEDDHVAQTASIAETLERMQAADGHGTADAGVEVEALSQVVTALSEDLVAARESNGGNEGLLKAVQELHETQDRLTAMLGQLLEKPDNSVHAAQEQFLRDVRVIIAELLAEGRRASVA
ncbi:Outer membrane protein and related peptidoglycan-associated (lipo)protein [Rhodovulum sp. P5]|nr:Outer membrane protein and related peptidoglycan-associated (lipo)protein [Rhodovulum sp. P5]